MMAVAERWPVHPSLQEDLVMDEIDLGRIDFWVWTAIVEERREKRGEDFCFY